MDFAVVRVAGKQYLVKEGDTIKITANKTEAGKNYPLSEVLLLADDGGLHIGAPLVPGAVIQAKIVGVGQGSKIRVAKFKAKSRYRRVMGFRAQETTLQVEKIGFAKEKVLTRKPKTAKV